MATPPRHLKRARRIAGWAIAALVALAAFYALAGWIGSAIPRNADWSEPADGVEIMVESNGVHTGIVMPLVTPQKDWRAEFPASHLPAPGRPYTHVSLSWGEREVFLNTPTWADLSPLTALRIIFLGGDGLIHVQHYVRPAPTSDMRPLVLSREQYARLVAAIERADLAYPRDLYPGYSTYDVFYDAPGRYHVRRTSNQWTSDRLAQAGVRTGWWTPFAGGVMKWVPDPER